MRRRRGQVDLSLGATSSLLNRLLDAERMTGRSPTQVVREVAENCLDVWLLARRMEQKAIRNVNHRLARQLAPR